MKVRFEWLEGVAAIRRKQWEAFALPEDSPLLDYPWLRALEVSGSVSPVEGWAPRVLACYLGDHLIAAAPFYLKTHSFGEFVYDFAFANAVENAGGDWYPKLVGMSPLTPSPVYRFLFSSDATESLMKSIYREVLKKARELGAKSLQFNFPDPGFARKIQTLDTALMAWEHQAFLWTRGELSNFSDYLDQFNRNQKRNIRREVQSMANQGIRVEMVDGMNAPSDWFSLMSLLYNKSNDQFGPWAARFLTDDFFPRLADLRPFFVFGAAFRGSSDQPFALSLLLKKGRGLIGRYWGSLEEVRDLYFNICYYKPIEYALANGYETFDPGAGSELKLRRGFRAISSPSLHRFLDSRLDALFRRYLPQMNQEARLLIESMNASIPFRVKGLNRLE